jgi:hypothetical protein
MPSAQAAANWRTESRAAARTASPIPLPLTVSCSTSPRASLFDPWQRFPHLSLLFHRCHAEQPRYLPERSAVHQSSARQAASAAAPLLFSPVAPSPHTAFSPGRRSRCRSHLPAPSCCPPVSGPRRRPHPFLYPRAQGLVEPPSPRTPEPELPPGDAIRTERAQPASFFYFTGAQASPRRLSPLSSTPATAHTRAIHVAVYPELPVAGESFRPDTLFVRRLIHFPRRSHTLSAVRSRFRRWRTAAPRPSRPAPPAQSHHTAIWPAKPACPAGQFATCGPLDQPIAAPFLLGSARATQPNSRLNRPSGR